MNVAIPVALTVVLATLSAIHVYWAVTGSTAGRGQLIVPAGAGSLVHWAAIAAGVVFLLRAVGEFRYVGFFKRRHGTRFATLDTWLFSPLCAFIGLAFVYVATRPWASRPD